MPNPLELLEQKMERKIGDKIQPMIRATEQMLAELKKQTKLLEEIAKK